MQQKVSIWHNQRCSTSRKGLELLETEFTEISIRNYLENPPTAKEIKEVLKKMGKPATYILRKKDPVFIEQFKGKELSNTAWIKAMSRHPSIIERPIIIIGENAFLARPLEEVMQQIKNDLS